MFILFTNIAQSSFTASLSLIAISAMSISLNASELSKVSLLQSKIEYQYAAQFSSLTWQTPTNSATLISLKPMKNYSGIPNSANKHKPEYYDHGKLPQSIEQLFTDLVLSTRILETGEEVADIEMQLTLNHYYHPFSYAPDDHWYKALQDEVDRWAVTKKNAKVGLTLTMTSLSHRFKPWISSVESTLSHCDLNDIKHALMPINHGDRSLSAYTESAMGQAFISASNYLLLQAVEHLNGQQKLAQVVSSSHNELLLNSEHNRFITGENYQLIFNHSYSHPLQQPAGTVRVVKSMGNQAIAYPVDLRPDHIKVGDWVQVGKTTALERPHSNFTAKNHCASVEVAQLNISSEGDTTTSSSSDLKDPINAS